MTIRVLITDDHAMLRAGLHTWLDAEPDLQVVGEAADAAQAIRLARELSPDVILMDLSIPGTDGGIGATRQIAGELPNVHVLILTVHEDRDMLEEAMRAGARGYTVKRAGRTELLDAIRSVANGHMYLHPVMTQGLLRHLSPPPGPSNGLAAALTRRETEVARLIVRGYTSREIAEELAVSVRTVEFHRSNLMDKLGIRTRVELVRYLEGNGLTPSGPM